MLIGNLRLSKSQDGYCKRNIGRLKLRIVLTGHQPHCPKNLSKTCQEAGLARKSSVSLGIESIQ